MNLIRFTCPNCSNTAKLPNDAELIYSLGPMGENGLQQYHLYCRRCKKVSVYEPPGCLSILLLSPKPQYMTTINPKSPVEAKYLFENLVSPKIYSALVEDKIIPLEL